MEISAGVLMLHAHSALGKASLLKKFNAEFIKVLFRRVSEMNIVVSRERTSVAGITHAYGVVKDEIDTDLPDISGQLIKPHSFSQSLPG
jgi:hypothetical protein